MAQTVKKVAILGGGLGSLSTAFALTNESNWKERYEITIYQTGWRLGGKGASGRNLDPDYQYRIEEHGFHVWMGFYDNAFAMIKQPIKSSTERPARFGPGPTPSRNTVSSSSKNSTRVNASTGRSNSRKGHASPGRRFSSGCSGTSDGCSRSCSGAPPRPFPGTMTLLPPCGVHGSCDAARNSSGA